MTDSGERALREIIRINIDGRYSAKMRQSLTVQEAEKALASRETAEPSGKYPIDRPCSICGDGDYAMEHHDHEPPFRKGYGPAKGICSECADGRYVCPDCQEYREECRCVFTPPSALREGEKS